VRARGSTSDDPNGLRLACLSASPCVGVCPQIFASFLIDIKASPDGNKLCVLGDSSVKQLSITAAESGMISVAVEVEFKLPFEAGSGTFVRSLAMGPDGIMAVTSSLGHMFCFSSKAGGHERSSAPSRDTAQADPEASIDHATAHATPQPAAPGAAAALAPASEEPRAQAASGSERRQFSATLDAAQPGDDTAPGRATATDDSGTTRRFSQPSRDLSKLAAGLVLSAADNLRGSFTNTFAAAGGAHGSSRS